uniref:15-cis-phytoene synthase n=1 Tax=Grateloupia chiangii TaxID=1561944 RepID=A0A2D2AGY2_9FLOR|nr:phytoene synthetase [Grateloupia chiangii]
MPTCDGQSLSQSPMAFAPVSTWVHSVPIPARPKTSSYRPSLRPSRPFAFKMVMEKPMSPSSNVNWSKYHIENFDTLHTRLGIDKLWQQDAEGNHHNAQDASKKGTALKEALDDIVVTGDELLSTQSVVPWDTTTGVRSLNYLGRQMNFLRKRQKMLKTSYEECRRITAVFSKTFYLGTTFLSPAKRAAVWAIYAWCRRTDDLVDGPRVQQRHDHLRTVLAEWEQRLIGIFQGRGRDSLDLALVDAVEQNPDITISPFRDMIRGMLMDVDQTRFETFDDLYVYCYRVAGTVGLMTLPVMGTVKPGREGLREAMGPALALGVGLQLTNILRDVGEDRLRGRIYIPLEDLRRFKYTEEDLFNGVLDSRYRELMKFEIARARGYFKEARKGVKLLADDSRLPVQTSLDMYSQILEVLEENGYDNFNRRAYVSKTQKLITLPVSYLRCRTSDAWKPIRIAAEFLLGVKQITSL